MYPNRTLCDVLGEMRKCHETRNFSYILGLIEEAQAMGNRMEGALEDIRDLRGIREEVKELQQKRRELIKENKDEI